MQIALILDRFDPNHGGLEYWAFQLAVWLRDRGHAVHIVATQFAPEMTERGFVLHEVARQPSRMALAGEIEHQVRSMQLDVVHDLGSGWYFDLLQPQFGSRLADARQSLLAMSRYRRFRLWFSPAERRRLRDARALEERQYASSGGRIIAVSEMTRKDLHEFHDIPAQRVTVIPNGVETGKFIFTDDNSLQKKIREKLAVDGKTVLLFAAHNFRLKGLDTLLKALVRVRGEGLLHLFVVGRGPVKKYRRRAERLGLQDCVTFCGFVEDIRDYYAVADIFVHPSFYDPCSLATLEALASGRPVITSRFNGAAELMQNGLQGIVLSDPADSAELAGALRQLMDDVLRQRMGKAARETALRCTSGGCFARILETYHQVQAEGQGRDSRFWHRQK